MRRPSFRSLETLGTLKTTILITTKNRRDELRRALKSISEQTAPLEVIVIDDGSSDGTLDMVRKEFPAVRTIRSDVSLGLIMQRNLGIEAAAGDIVISIDDDVEMVDRETVRKTIADFNDPRVAVVGIPFFEFRRGSVSNRQFPPDRSQTWVTDSFFGGAHAVRRDIFLGIGGFDASLQRQGEEFDLALRLLDAGYVVRLGSSNPMEHHEAPRRSDGTNIRLGARNDILRAWKLVPMPYLAGRMAKTVVHWLSVGAREKSVVSVVRGLGEGITASGGKHQTRRPVSREAYRADRALRHHGPLALAEVVERLPPRAPL